MHRSTLALATVLTLATGAVGRAGDWPQFRGPARDGIAMEEDVAESWPAGGPRELWRRPFGSGFSTVARVGGKLFTMGAEGETENVLCLDAASGATRWSVPLGPRFVQEFGDGPRATPTVADGVVYATTSNLHFAALDAESGEVLWKHDLSERFEAKASMFGYASSALVNGEIVLLDVGGPKGAVVAFDRESGEPVWTALEGSASAASPILVEIDGVPQYVFTRRSGPDTLALSLDGEVLWRHPGAEDVIALPHFLPPDRFFTSSAQRGDGGVLFHVRHEGGEWKTEREWVNRRLRVHFNDAVFVAGHLFGFDNSTLRCVDVENGEIRWSAREFGKGSLMACGDRLFVLGDQGLLALVEANPEEYRELGRTQALEGRCWTSPSLSHGVLYVRSLEEIVAYDVSAGAALAAGPGAEREVASSAESGTEAAAALASLGLDEILARYAVARGGAERWEAIESLRSTGTFSAFSASAPFTWIALRGDLYRFDHTMLGQHDVHGRDEEGPWWQANLLEAAKPQRVGIEPYLPQLRREARFEPPLLHAREQGQEVELRGVGEFEGAVTLDVVLRSADGDEELYRLDPRTFLERCVESRCVDYTQSQEAMDRRVYPSDWREVEGLVLPFRTVVEFGARLEEFLVESVEVDGDVDVDACAMPKD